MPILLRLTAFTSLILIGAIFGFFYAWVCSTMWGLDAADPRIAIGAMQAMNSLVRNIVFAPAFFATPFVLFLTGMVAWRMQRAKSAISIWFGGAGLLVWRANPDGCCKCADEYCPWAAGNSR